MTGFQTSDGKRTKLDKELRVLSLLSFATGQFSNSKGSMKVLGAIIGTQYLFSVDLLSSRLFWSTDMNI